MTGFADYDDYDACGLADLVRSKKVSAGELLAEAKARCDRVNGEINAVIHRRDTAASRDIERLSDDAPFAGVPFLVKDLGPALAGSPLTMGSRLFANYVPTEDGVIVKAFKAAGLIAFGKTNIPEFGSVPVTEPELFGVCRNPWDLTRTPGGSSGGAAAAVASGIVPMAHASDGGGSIRIPASCCGLVGLKPSRGYTLTDPSKGMATEPFVADHVVSRSVRDSAALLDAIGAMKAQNFAAGLDRPREQLRIAVVRSAMLGQTVDPEVRKGLEKTAQLLASMGHYVEDAEPQINYPEAAMAFLTWWSMSVSQMLTASEKITGRKANKADVEFATFSLGDTGSAMSKEDYSHAGAVIDGMTAKFAAFFDRYDILLSPVLATLPLRIGESKIKSYEKFIANAVSMTRSGKLMKALLQQIASKSFAFAAFTAPFNMTGQPAIAVPMHWTPDGLPIGMQFAAKHGADGLLLNLARQLEIAEPWAARRPKIWAGDPILAAA